MTARSDEVSDSGPRWRYVGLAIAILVVTALSLAGLFQLPRLVPALGVQPSPTTAPTARSLPPTPIPTPAVTEPSIVGMAAVVDDTAHTIRFQLDAAVAPDRRIGEVILWYDTVAGSPTGWTQQVRG
jgi:hypothetical protein